MRRLLRSLARRALGVTRTPAYYLPWLTRPGLDCALILSNVESRFRTGAARGPLSLTVDQHDRDGSLFRRYEVALPDATATVELPLAPAPGGCGIAFVRGEGLHSDLYVTLTGGETYTATHGRGEFVERYPARARVALAAASAALAVAGRGLPAFARDQYVYAGPDARSHLLLMNLANVPNRLRLELGRAGASVRHEVRLAPLGSALVDVGELVDRAGSTHDSAGPVAWHARLWGNAWFNLYLVGAGARDLAGPLSLMHVK